MASWRYAVLGFFPVFAFCAAALGVASIHFVAVLRLPWLARFVFGICLTPFFLGGSFLATTTAFPGAPASVHIAAPVLACILLLFLARRSVKNLAVRLLPRNIRWGLGASRRR